MGGAGLEPAAPSLSIWGSRSRPFAQVRSNSTRDPAGVRFDHLPTEDEVAQVSDRWRPYRSLAVSYLFAPEYGAHP